MQILEANPGRDLDQARTLFREYAAEWNINLCFQNFEVELASLPGCYARPSGCLLLARDDEEVAGCAALREFAPGIAEMKRLYVRPSYRRVGLGRQLAERIIEQAWSGGYARMRLDTLARMESAVALYENLGFQRIAAYRVNPEPDVLYMELVRR
jgi:putative acetyltransferase